MTSDTVCETWEARRKDLFNKRRRSCGRNQILKKREKMLEEKEKHTLTKTKNQNLQIPKTENQKDKKTTNGEKSFSSKKDFCILIRPGSAQYSILLHTKHPPFQFSSLSF